MSSALVNSRMAEEQLAVRGACRAAKVVSRQAKGILRDQQVRRATFTRCRNVAKSFFLLQDCHLMGAPTIVVEFDHALMSWAECLWAEGDSKSVLSYGISALQHFVPSLRNHLHGAWRLHAAWRRMEPSTKAPPLSLLMYQAVAGWFLEKGLPDVALMLMLSFACILRTQEMLTLLRSGVSVSSSTVMLTLRATTMGSRLGIIQDTSTSDAWLVPRPCKFANALRPGSSMMSLAGWEFRK